MRDRCDAEVVWSKIYTDTLGNIQASNGHKRRALTRRPATQGQIESDGL